MYYILDGKTPKRVDLMEWAKFIETNCNRHIGDTLLKVNRHVRVRISTIFLGLDYSSFIGGPPILFETMIFGIKDDSYQWRYTTWEAAEKGHKYAVNLAKNHIKWMQKTIKTKG